MRLKGKVALVTGASRGIGRAIALAFASEGADLAVNYLHSEHAAQQVVAEIDGFGRRSFSIRADVSSREEVEGMVSHVVERLGRLDILVNNAGIILPFCWEEPDYENWQRMIEVNVKGILLCSHAASQVMHRQGGGKIINITVHETKGSLDYIMTKAAGDVLTRGLARELAPQIPVNAIAPGYVDTGYISALSAEEQGKIRKQIPLKRWGQADDVASVAVFLASDEANWMTGTTIHVDGGEVLNA